MRHDSFSGKKNSDMEGFADNFFIKRKREKFSRNIAGFFEDVSDFIAS